MQGTPIVLKSAASETLRRTPVDPQTVIELGQSLFEGDWEPRLNALFSLSIIANEPANAAVLSTLPVYEWVSKLLEEKIEQDADVHFWPETIIARLGVLRLKETVISESISILGNLSDSRASAKLLQIITDSSKQPWVTRLVAAMALTGTEHIALAESSFAKSSATPAMVPLLVRTCAEAIDAEPACGIFSSAMLGLIREIAQYQLDKSDLAHFKQSLLSASIHYRLDSSVRKLAQEVFFELGGREEDLLKTVIKMVRDRDYDEEDGLCAQSKVLRYLADSYRSSTGEVRLNSPELVMALAETARYRIGNTSIHYSIEAIEILGQLDCAEAHTALRALITPQTSFRRNLAAFSALAEKQLLNLIGAEGFEACLSTVAKKFSSLRSLDPDIDRARDYDRRELDMHQIERLIRLKARLHPQICSDQIEQIIRGHAIGKGVLESAFEALEFESAEGHQRLLRLCKLHNFQLHGLIEDYIDSRRPTGEKALQIAAAIRSATDFHNRSAVMRRLKALAKEQ